MARSLTPEEQELFLHAVDDDLGVPACPEGHCRGDYYVEIPGEQLSAVWMGADEYRREDGDVDVHAILSLTITSASGTQWVADLPVRAEDIARREEL
jgi:hypothetical protein